MLTYFDIGSFWTKLYHMAIIFIHKYQIISILVDYFWLLSCVSVYRAQAPVAALPGDHRGLPQSQWIPTDGAGTGHGGGR